MKKLSLAQARRIALAAQGFGDSRPSSVGVRQFRRALERMTILQLDSVNVLCRSHFLPFFARLGAYDRDELDQFIWRSGENLECLAHEASVTRVNHFSLLRDRMTIERWKSGKRFRDENAEYLKAVVAEIKKNGPMSVKDLKDAGPRAGPWWGWSKGKVALEVLYRSGRLAIAYRTKSFLTHYDLVERVVSKEVRSRKISDAEAQKEKLVLAAKSHGIGSDKDLADYFRMKVSLCRPLLEALADEGRLKRVQVEGFESVAYMHAKAKGPRACKARALLSPFDPVVWCRPRALRLFDFHYRIEIYVPQNKRKYGYYVLPFLLGDKIVGRVDVKADRKNKILEAKAAFIEPANDVDEVAFAMAKTLKEMAQWLQLDALKVGRKGNLARALASANR